MRELDGIERALARAGELIAECPPGELQSEAWDQLEQARGDLEAVLAQLRGQAKELRRMAAQIIDETT